MKKVCNELVGVIIKAHDSPKDLRKSRPFILFRGVFASSAYSARIVFWLEFIIFGI